MYRSGYEICVEIFKMSNEHQQIKLNSPRRWWSINHPMIYFNKNGNIIIHDLRNILVYSTHGTSEMCAILSGQPTTR
jgi:hypothetical protein